MTGTSSQDIYEKLRSMRLLVVDDSELVRSSLASWFASEGCAIETVATAEEGLRVLERRDCDIVIVDYRLPLMDGLELLERMPHAERRVVTILITAYLDEQVETRARELGVDAVLEKPMTTRSLEQTMARLLAEGPDEENR